MRVIVISQQIHETFSDLNNHWAGLSCHMKASYNCPFFWRLRGRMIRQDNPFQKREQSFKVDISCVPKLQELSISNLNDLTYGITCTLGDFETSFVAHRDDPAFDLKARK